MPRDYKLAAQVAALDDDAMVDPKEIAALIGLAEVTVQQQKVRDFPKPNESVRHLRWRLGDVRKWVRGGAYIEAETRRPGRPTKAEQIAISAVAGRAQ